MKTTKVPECKRPTANQEYIRKLAKALLLFPMILFLLSGCTDSLEDGLPGSESDPIYYHSTGWKDNPQHGSDFSTNPQNCNACHGEDLKGGPSGVSCVACHHCGFSGSPDVCQVCHGDYTDSAHGDVIDGVNHSDKEYTPGVCTHCHDVLDPSTCGVNELMLFAAMNPANQTDNFCFQCHTDTDSLQEGGIINRDYSGTFGGALDGVTGIKEAFNQLSYHNLDDILNFATGEWPSTFTGDSNACSACHNVHIARQNKENPGDPTYTAISKPSDLENLWGDDDPDERMTAADYGDYYQPPYHTDPNLEPDGAGSDRATQAGKTPDYVTFCQDCHTTDMGLAPYDFGLSNTPVDWETTGDESNLPDSAGGDKHGMNIATSDTHFLQAPYAGAWTDSGLVLSCTDCHEPHGAPNEMLVRGEVNGAQVTIGSIGSADVDLKGLCLRCHQTNNIWSIHHQTPNPDAPYDDSAGGGCGDCHSQGWNTGPTSICSNCHFHGGDDSWLLTAPTITNGSLHYTGRRTF